MDDSPLYPPGEDDRPRRRVPRVAVAAGLTAFLALAGAGLAVAASGGGGTAASLSSSSASSTTSVPGPAPHHKMGRHGAPFGGARFGGPVVHGEYTIRDGSTVAVQVGQVGSVSATAITVVSSDGYTQTYTVQPSTIVDSQSGGISAVAAKDTVRVEAVVNGSTRTATGIIDTTKIGASRKGFGFGDGPPGPGGAGPMPGPGGPGAPPTAT